MPIERQSRSPSSLADSICVENRQEADKDGDLVLESTPVILNSEFASLGGDYFDWNDADVDFADILYPHADDENVQSISLTPVPIPTAPTNTVRSLNQRPKMNAGTQRIATLILHTLKSYPLMIMRHDALPPFVHPHLISSDVVNDQMEPLTNCISLVHMINSGIRGSRKLFWKNVRLECERLCTEVRRVCDVSGDSQVANE